MKKKWLIVICAVFLTAAITTVSFAASQNHTWKPQILFSDLNQAKNIV